LNMHTQTSVPDEKLKALVEKSLSDDKGDHIVSIDLDPNLALADTMFIVSGTSGRHIAAMAEKLKERLKTKGYNDINIEGVGNSNWVVVDAGDIIVHLFRPEVREFYNIEKMWGMDTPTNGHRAGHA
jgi:ribosome-associated protein